MNLVVPHSVHISVNNADPIEIPIVIAEDQNDNEIWNQWYSYLTDCIASEVLILTDKGNSLAKQIHCELLEQRINAIFLRVNSTSSTYSRLESLLESVQTIKSGGSVDKLKLNDMKFEGKFATTKSIKKAAIDAVPDKIHYSYKPATVPVGSWITINLKRQRRVNSSKKSKEFLIVVGLYNSTNARKWIRDNINYIKHETDENGSNPVAVASSIGRCALVEELLKVGSFNINNVNSKGYNALDLALLYGYWVTAEILIQAGAKNSVNGETLLRTCLSNKHVKTASVIVKHKIAVVTDELVNASPNSEIAVWLSNKNNKEIPIEVAIEKGIYDTVEEKLSQISHISWEQYPDIFTKPTPDHIRIVDLLLYNRKADPIEVLCYDDEGEAGISWPLFMACEKGQDAMFDVLLKYYTKEMLNKQNHKGTTALWIASCNKNTDIVMKLLDKGADPNISNIKGDGPLIPACQKGVTMVVDMLLDNGAKLDCYNKNRDGPILICCRAGQPKILDSLLKRLSKEEVSTLLNTSAEIDGFVPIMASTELDNVECIRVCYKYGASLETRTDDSNKIIQGATPLHLACFYGRLASVNALYEMGANMVSQTTVHGYTPLHIAIRQGHIKLVRYLLSLEKVRPSVEMADTNGRLPAYYANIVGNEQILEEFFTNKLALSLTKVLVSDEATEKECSEVLEKYGRSLGCYEYGNVTSVDIGDGTTIGTYAMLNGNEHLMKTLSKMDMDMQKSDDFGITPEFWARYLGYTKSHPELMSGMEIDSDNSNSKGTKLDEMLENVANTGKKSTQNKIILALAPAKLQLLEGGVSVNPIVKMSDGYGLNITPSTIVSLKGSHSTDHSLLGFIDKLKNNKVFPDGEQCLKYIMFDAKINVIKRIANGEKVLQPNHMMSLYLYTSNYTIFKQVNSILNHWNSPTASIWTPFINCLYSAINLLKPYVGEVYRAVNSKFTLEEYAMGNKITWDTFSLGSYEWKNSSDLIGRKTGIVFIIHSKTGRVISKYSKYPVDAEVIFLPGTSFTVTNHYIADQICLGQANIRNTTFKMKENDYVKPLNGNASIIVELTEN
jgi:ankyrin repeat protein